MVPWLSPALTINIVSGLKGKLRASVSHCQTWNPTIITLSLLEQIIGPHSQAKGQPTSYPREQQIRLDTYPKRSGEYTF